jgi:hypothetical protein
MARWNDETVMKFVKLYETEVCLWQTSDSDYKNKNARIESLKKIVGAMDLKSFGVPECKQTITYIRSHYCQELKKIRNSKISGSGPDSVYKPTLVWFKTVDAFLRPFTAQTAQCKSVSTLLLHFNYSCNNTVTFVWSRVLSSGM